MNTTCRHTLKRGAAIVALMIVAGLVIAGIVQVLHLRGHLLSAQAALNQMDRLLAGGGAGLLGVLEDPQALAGLTSTVSSLDSDLSAMQRILRPLLPLAPYLSWLPAIGGEITAAPELLAMARHTTGAVQELLDALTPIAPHLTGSGMGLGALGPVLVADIGGARASLEEAQALLQQARQVRAALSTQHLTDRTRALFLRFDRYLPAFERGLDALELLPSLLGADRPRTYLLLAQNSDELRATGGFISGVGQFRLEAGRLTDIDFRDSYAVDNLQQAHPSPPAPLRRYMKADMLVLRDANWWPDFPTSARAVAELYRQDQGVGIDGVIGVDLTTLRLLVQALGPIDVPGYDQPVTAENLQTMLMQLWQAPLLTAPGMEMTDWWAHRKDFAGDVMSAILVRAMGDLASDELSALVEGLRTALKERHLVIYVNDPQASSLLATLGWNGALRPSSADYLMIVDSNVGFNKVNPNVEQTIDYKVELGESAASAQLTLTYRHRVERPSPACVHEPRYGESYADLMERCYWDYVRIYVPLGSELVQLTGSDGEPEIYQDGNHTVIATAFLLETGQSRQIQIIYRPRLPEAQTEYSLVLQKQPGTEAPPVRVSVRPPPDANLTSADPSPLAQVDGAAIWQGALRQDWDLHLEWR